MSGTVLIQFLCGLLAVVIGGVIIFRRKRQASH
jgi:hypothetical protein